MQHINSIFLYIADIHKNKLSVEVLHLLWLIPIAMFIILIIFLFTKLNKKNSINILKLLAALLLATEVIRTMWALYYGNYQVSSMLPLHLCGIMVFIEFLAVYYNKEFLKEFSYCCGLPGAFIGLANPDASGFTAFSFQYILYIIRHGLLVVIPLLMIFAYEFKPKINNLFKSYFALCLLAAIDTFVNFKLHSNYLFISKIPPLKLLAGFYEKVGYSGYVILLILSSFIVITFMYMPWIINSKVKKGKEVIVGANK